MDSCWPYLVSTKYKFVKWKYMSAPHYASMSMSELNFLTVNIN